MGNFSPSLTFCLLLSSRQVPLLLQFESVVLTPLPLSSFLAAWSPSLALAEPDLSKRVLESS